MCARQSRASSLALAAVAFAQYGALGDKAMEAREALSLAFGVLRAWPGALGRAAREVLPSEAAQPSAGTPLQSLHDALCMLRAEAAAVTADPLAEPPAWLLGALRVVLLVLQSPETQLEQLQPGRSSACLQQLRRESARLLCDALRLCERRIAGAAGGPGREANARLRHATICSHYTVRCSLAATLAAAAAEAAAEETVAAAGGGGGGGGTSATGDASPHLRWAGVVARLQQRPQLHSGGGDSAEEWEAGGAIAGLEGSLRQLSDTLVGAAARPSAGWGWGGGDGRGALHWMALLLPRAAARGCAARESPPLPAAEAAAV